ncbi:MAG TPA: FeoB small GTPase domain-containing protein, partial [Xanthomonadales bacterium]|nr:FeoB small GTPase domain-containing protein [Xanthomonadales bacterium]
MSEAKTIGISIDEIGIRRKARTSIAVIGNPNSGKSTLFNRLTGLRQSTGNYPGVTVEKHVGITQLPNSAAELIDLPGIYCLSGGSADERIAVDVLLGRVESASRPSGLLVVLDATHLYQGLYLLEQLLELSIPTVVAITMIDVAHANGLSLDLDALSKRLGGIPICEVMGSTGFGISQLKEELERLPYQASRGLPQSWPELSHAAMTLSNRAGGTVKRIDVLQALLHPNSHFETSLGDSITRGDLQQARNVLFSGEPPQAEEARRRYLWVREVLDEIQQQAPLFTRYSARFTRWLNRPWPATVMFFAVMILVFQAVFSWATPLMELIETGAASLGAMVNALFGDSALTSF